MAFDRFAIVNSVSDPDPHKKMPPGSGSRREKNIENVGTGTGSLGEVNTELEE